MFKFTLLSYLLIAGLLSQLQALAPKEPAPLIAHLIEVNVEWARQAPDWPELQQVVDFNNDEQRIQMHLKWVSHILRQRASTCQVRGELLDVLQQYWKRGLFPKNSHHAQRQPYFIDGYGTACAVGYLIQKSGYERFAAQIAKENNYAYIHEMTYPELPQWASKHGFTVDELAWIQPGYSPPLYQWNEYGNNINARVEVLLTDTLNNLVYAAGAFDSLGSMANCGAVAVWDGQSWAKLGNGVNGNIQALEIHNGTVIAAGAFQLNGQEANIASWDGSTWQPLQTGPMNGSIRALKSYDCALYVGGDFSQIGGSAHPYFALWDGTVWNTQGASCSQSPPFTPEEMLLDGPVNDFAVHPGTQGGLYVAGSFTKATSNGQSYSSPGLIRWNRYFWDFTQQEITSEVVATTVYDNELFVALVDTVVFQIKRYDLSSSQWQDSIPLQGSSLDFEFVEGYGYLYAVGGFLYTPLIGHYGNGMMLVAPYPDGVTDINAPVTAATFFGGEILLAGAFDYITGGNSGPGQHSSSFSSPGPFRIVSTEFTPVSDEEPESEAFAQLRYYDAQYWLHFDAPQIAARLRLFDVQGRLLLEQEIPLGSTRQVLALPQAAKGVYVYQLELDGKKEVGRFVQ